MVTLLLLGTAPLPAAETAGRSNPSQLLEISGKVEVFLLSSNLWNTGRLHQTLHAGDKLRTGPDSRAALRLSDKSIIRIDQNTLVEITPTPESKAKGHFKLSWGTLFFLDREKPSEIEFETPLATGAIRGTEFLLTVSILDASTSVVLYDGAVDLINARETISLQSGQQAFLAPGKAAVVSAALPARSLMQWTFYYPGILNLDELRFTDVELGLYEVSRQQYQAGHLVAALAGLPPWDPAHSEGARAFRAALKLSVGRVEDALSILAGLTQDSPPARALQILIPAVSAIPAVSPAEQGKAEPLPRTSSEWLATSYLRQSQARLREALAAARSALALAPWFGLAWARVAELEFGFGHHAAAREALLQARTLLPRHAEAQALEGFIALDQLQPKKALPWFTHAIELDPALGHAWLGRSIAHEQLGDAINGRRDLQTAVALEPQRSLFRSYLAKGFAQAHEDELADREFRLAQALDPHDPTPWLYAGLHAHQMNRLNEAARNLERSQALNDNASVFRSRLLLDRDRAIRSADLAALYQEVGLGEYSRLTASRAVGEDYSNFSGHLFLARSLQTREDPNRYDLRYETPRQSELLVANLLAPPGGANLSQLLSQQDHLTYFERRGAGASSLTDYRSNGDLEQSASLFGIAGALSYAVDAQYLSRNGQGPNNAFDQHRYIASFKEQLTPTDSVFFQVGTLSSESGDVAQHYDPAQANGDLHVEERQEPTVYAGFHHAWRPGQDTLFLVSHLRDHLQVNDVTPSLLFLRRSGGAIIDLGLSPLADLSFESEFDLTSLELQHIWQSERHDLIAGGRYQNGTVESRSTLLPLLPGPAILNSVSPGLQRVNAYTYYKYKPSQALRVTLGMSYDDLGYPENADLPVPTDHEQHRSLLSPKAALEFEPWLGGHGRLVYTRSLGGLYFDNSVRLEPTQLAGFITDYRSLIPESVAGVVPGTEFDTYGIGFDQSFSTGTYLGVSGELLQSEATRGVGALSNSGPLPVPDTASSTRQSLIFTEKSLTLYVNQLIDRNWSLAANYRLSEADYTAEFTGITSTAPNLPLFNQNEQAVLGRLQLAVLFNHESGFFSQWLSAYHHQQNQGYTPALADAGFWQHDLVAGYRFPRRRAILQLGVLNLLDNAYQLNPLNLHPDLPRHRSFVASLKLNF